MRMYVLACAIIVSSRKVEENTGRRLFREAQAEHVPEPAQEAVIEDNAKPEGEYALLQEEFDSNKDGKVSVGEIRSRLQENFEEEFGEKEVPAPLLSLLERSDVDKDGFISAGEVPALDEGFEQALLESGLMDDDDEEEGSPANSEDFASLLEQVDANKDGAMSLDEVKAQWAKDFKEEYGLDAVPAAVLSLLEAGDANKNGQIDAEEVPYMRHGMEAVMSAEGLGEPKADEHLASLLEPEEASDEDFAALLEQVDTNKDGKVSKDEVKAQWAKDFKDEFHVEAIPGPVLSLLEAGDANSDGFIGREEVPFMKRHIESALVEAGLVEDEDEHDMDHDMDHEPFDDHLMDDQDLHKSLIEAVDTNGDGEAQLSEIEAVWDKDFKQEYGIETPASAKALLELADENKDGKIDMHELPLLKSEFEHVLVEEGLERPSALLEEPEEEEEDEAPEDFEDEEFEHGMAEPEFSALVEKLDTDKDGKLSLGEVKSQWAKDVKDDFGLDEVPQSLTSLLAIADENQNGFVELEEVPTLMAHMEEALHEEGLSDEQDKSFASLLEQVDTNKDGKVSHDEVKAKWVEEFKDEFGLEKTPQAVLSLLEATDANKNGIVDRKEVVHMTEGIEHAMHQAGLTNEAEGDFASFVEQVDADKDGKMSLAEVQSVWKKEVKEEFGVDEVPAPVVALLERADADKSGFIERDEVHTLQDGFEAALAEAGVEDKKA